MWANSGEHLLVKNGFTPPGPYRLGFDGHWAAYNFNHHYFQAPYFNDDANPHIRKQYEPTGQTDEAIRYLHAAKRDSEPFALFLSWGPPHYPWGINNVDPEFAEMFREVNIPLAPNYTTVQDPYCDILQKLPPNYDRVVHDWMRTYYAQVANLDWNLGRLMKAMDDAGLTDDTIFVFTSDHGKMFGSHGRQAKLIFYEEASRIPFIVRWPGKIRPGSVSEALLGTPDIMPTLLSMLNISIPRSVEGMDLSKQIQREGGPDHEAAHMQGMGATFQWVDGTEWRALRDHEFTYAIYRKDGSELLFNNRRDPYQMTNLANDRSFGKARLHYRAMSAAWRKERNDTFEACSWYKRWTQDRDIINTATGVTQDLNELRELQEKWLPPTIGDKFSVPWGHGGARHTRG